MIGIIFSALFLGFFTGRFFLAPIAKPLLDTILMTALAVMVFCAGADIGSSRQIVRRFLTVKTLGLSLLVLLATNVGSLGGGLIMGYLMGVPFRDALLVSAGMGWYSLSSVLLSAAVGTETGTLAFLANALRELLTILGIPLLARFCHLPLVVVGGATSMDSTMPILLQCAGRPAAILGSVEGYHPLSVSVPCPDAVPSLCHLYRPFYPLLAAGLHAAFFKCHAPACRGLSH